MPRVEGLSQLFDTTVGGPCHCGGVLGWSELCTKKNVASCPARILSDGPQRMQKCLQLVWLLLTPMDLLLPPPDLPKLKLN